LNLEKAAAVAWSNRNRSAKIEEGPMAAPIRPEEKFAGLIEEKSKEAVEG
jgi:hypothetical protein